LSKFFTNFWTNQKLLKFPGIPDRELRLPQFPGIPNGLGAAAPRLAVLGLTTGSQLKIFYVLNSN